MGKNGLKPLREHPAGVAAGIAITSYKLWKYLPIMFFMRNHSYSVFVGNCEGDPRPHDCLPVAVVRRGGGRGALTPFAGMFFSCRFFLFSFNHNSESPDIE